MSTTRRPLPLARVASIAAAAVLVLTPPSDMSGSEWTETFRILGQEDSGAPGRPNLDARPYQRDILDAIADPDFEEVTVVGPSQWGKTFCMGSAVGQIIHQAPAPTMIVFDTLGAAKKWSRTRLDSMVKSTPVLTPLISQAGRSRSNTMLEKQFRGGVVVMVGANTPGGLASQPIKNLFFEELDRIPIDQEVSKEGDFEDLAIARTTDPAFLPQRKIYRSSSPTELGRSRIVRAFNRSDMRYRFFKCPHCGHLQRPEWEQVKLQGEDAEAATYTCSGSGCTIHGPELRRAMRAGRWIATRPEVRRHAGFWLSGLEVRDLSYVVQEFLKAKHKAGGPREWKNTVLGELFNTREGEEAKATGLLARARAETYSSGEVPDGVAVLTAGVDVQTSNPQRLEVVVRGHGLAGEQSTILHRVIPGNLFTLTPWDELEDLLLHEFPRQSGGVLRIKAAAIDTGGHFRKQVLDFRKRPRMTAIVHPVKGASRYQRKLCVRAKTAYVLHFVDTVQAKDAIFGALQIPAPGPGFQHFPNDTEEVYFQQLLSERPCSQGGKRAYERYPKDAAAEVLDCHVYSEAAWSIMRGPELNLEKMLSGLPVRIGVPRTPMGDTEDTVQPAPATPPQEDPMPPRPSRTSRVTVKVIETPLVLEAEPEAKPEAVATPAPAPVQSTVQSTVQTTTKSLRPVRPYRPRRPIGGW